MSDEFRLLVLHVSEFRREEANRVFHPSPPSRSPEMLCDHEARQIAGQVSVRTTQFYNCSREGKWRAAVERVQL